ncbi:NAD(P)-binding protein [Cadophora sp. DSE1049]|nr:NAD(P)-binding protein [Cadophora sp. DSE1049]
MESKEIYDQVNKRYGSIDKSSTGRYEQTVAKAFGYTEEELAGIPEDANLGLSCGNPHALAKLREAETVIDLGSGAGFDVFTAAKRVGPSGKTIGVDMNKNMIEKANVNKAKTNAENVEFIEGAITSIPLPDNTADCIISNCVINLVPAAEKQLAFNEMYRLLKPGGRVAISDILARKELTKDMKKNIALYVGCISGASQVSEYEAYLKKAGFRGESNLVTGA